MRIAVDLTPIYDHLTGVERYNINIVKSMIELHPEDEYILVFKQEIHKEFLEISKRGNVTPIVLKPCNKLLFLQFRLLHAMNRIEADYYLFLSFTSPYFFRKQRTISAIHDLTCWDCPESIPGKMKYYYRITYRATAKHNWKIVTVSKFSQRRICERYGLRPDNVPVIYDGLTDVFRNPMKKDVEYITHKYELPERYILSLSTIEPRKNLQLLIEAYKELADGDIPDLVLAGRKGWKLDEIMDGLNQMVRDRIHFTGFIDDEDLPALYRNAELFVFPSKYEGFGLPVIEAMSQGVLVLSSDAASLPEVVGDCGVLFKSGDIKELKDKIRYCLALESEKKQKICEKGKNVAHYFDWQKEADKLYNIMGERK